MIFGAPNGGNFLRLPMYDHVEEGAQAPETRYAYVRQQDVIAVYPYASSRYEAAEQVPGESYKPGRTVYDVQGAYVVFGAGEEASIVTSLSVDDVIHFL